jgi:membrane protein
VLLMWLYFSAAVLLHGAEFSAARGRMHDPRGGWGMQEEAPPGSRAMLASVLAASTVSAVSADGAANASKGAPRNAATSGTPGASGAPGAQATPAARAAAAGLAGTPSAAAPATMFRTQTRKNLATRATAVKVGRQVLLAEAQATRLAAVTLLETSRKAAAADRYVRRNPWTSVLLAAVAGLAAATVARRSIGETDDTRPS